jgi:hypothetical protein
MFRESIVFSRWSGGRLDPVVSYESIILESGEKGIESSFDDKEFVDLEFLEYI